MSYRSCRACPECAAGRPYYCARFAALNASGVRPDGSTTHERERPSRVRVLLRAVELRDAMRWRTRTTWSWSGGDVDLSVAAPFGCSVQTGAGTVMNVLELDERSSLVVFGAGGVGLPAVMAARALGVADDRRRRSGRSAAGSSPPSWVRPPPSTRRSTTSSKRCGTTRAAARRARSRRPRSPTCSCRRWTASAPAARASRSASACRSSPSAWSGSRAASRCGRRSRATRIRTSRSRGSCELHARGELPVEKLIRTYRFADFGRALRDAESGATIKPVLVH